jgi:hypothetical protein
LQLKAPQPTYPPRGGRNQPSLMSRPQQGRPPGGNVPRADGRGTPAITPAG